jgi:hypothetical protein
MHLTAETDLIEIESQYHLFFYENFCFYAFTPTAPNRYCTDLIEIETQ